MGKSAKFMVLHMGAQEPLAQISMDIDLLHPDAGIMDESCTLRKFKGGSAFTIVPFTDDPTIATLKRIEEVHKLITEKPAFSINTMIDRYDQLLMAVGRMFGEVEFILVENAEDMNRILNPPTTEYQHKTIKHSILGDLREKVLGPQTPAHDHDHDADGNCIEDTEE